MLRRSVLVLVLVALLAGACGNDNKKSKASGGGAQTFVVDVDVKSDPDVNVGSTAYFPEQLSAHPGDTVKFENYFTGEPHTVTMGTLVNAGIEAAKAIPANPTGPPPDEPAALKKLPDLLPSGPGDAPQVSANPCYIETGELPADTSKPCTVQTQPEFNGKQAFYNSGFLPSGTDFTVKLAPTTAPGKYWFFCLLHRAAMSGAVTVVAKGTKIPGAEEVEKNGETAQSQLTTQLKTAVTAAGAAASAQKAAAGVGAQGVQNATSDVFLPSNITVASGGTVTWFVTGAHTISFNPPAPNRLALAKAPDGTWHLNAAAFTPNPPGIPPLDGGGKSPVVIDGGKWDGTGYKGSGVMLAFGPPGSYSYKLTFTKAGAYPYECLIHPGMIGKVTVT